MSIKVSQIREAIRKMKNLQQPSEDGVYTMLAYRYFMWRGNVYELVSGGFPMRIRLTPYKELPYFPFKTIDDTIDLSRVIV